MGRLSGHPHIVSVHRGGTTDAGAPYIVMDLMDGGSLADRLHREGPLPWPEVLEIGVAVAGALETAHRAGILHLDVKPANVLVSRYGEPKLADFGISRLPGVTATTDGRVRASIAYAAPERLLDGTATPSADLYALGGTLYTLLVGETAFSTKPGEDLLVAISRIVRQPVPDLRLHGVPDPVVRVIERLLAKSPVDRYATRRGGRRGAAGRPARHRPPGHPGRRGGRARGRTTPPGPGRCAGGRGRFDDEPRAGRPGPADPAAVRAAGLGRSGHGRAGPGPGRVHPGGPDPDPVGRGDRRPAPECRPSTDRVPARHPGRAAGRRRGPRIRRTGSVPGPTAPASAGARARRWRSCSGSRWPPASCWRNRPAPAAAGATVPTTAAPAPHHRRPRRRPTAAPPQIAVAGGVDHPDRDAVAARLDGYFRALNDRDYETAFAAFSPDSAVVDNGLAAFRTGNSTTEVAPPAHPRDRGPGPGRGAGHGDLPQHPGRRVRPGRPDLHELEARLRADRPAAADPPGARGDPAAGLLSGQPAGGSATRSTGSTASPATAPTTITAGGAISLRAHHVGHRGQGGPDRALDAHGAVLHHGDRGVRRAGRPRSAPRRTPRSAPPPSAARRCRAAGRAPASRPGCAGRPAARARTRRRSRAPPRGATPARRPRPARRTRWSPRARR